jgi:hypothetical protein
LAPDERRWVPQMPESGIVPDERHWVLEMLE